MSKSEWIDNVYDLLCEAMSYYKKDHSTLSKPPSSQQQNDEISQQKRKSVDSTAKISDEYSHLYIFSPCKGGINNVMFYVDFDVSKDPSNNSVIRDANKDNYSIDFRKRYVIRLYNNGKDDKKVFFEHKVLQLIHSTQSASEISSNVGFEYPTLLHVKTAEERNVNETSVLLCNGIRAALFHFIPGQLAQFDVLEPVGQACGYTSTLLAKVTDHFTLDELKQFPTRPYYDLFHAHHVMNRPLFFSLIESSIYDPIRSEMNFLVNEILSLELKLMEFHTLDLPKQIIHGDLHFNNILHIDQCISGVLDFEFVSYDWRAMDLAINLSGYCATDDPMIYLNNFLIGYVMYGKLSDLEIQCIPDLIKLRILNNVVYFVSRAYTKEDSPDSLLCRGQSYVTRITWLKNNHDGIISSLQAHFSRGKTD